jgi:hypothetical protein
MKFKLHALFLSLVTSFGAFAVEATPEQIASLKPKFTVQDCALWKGGAGHENDNVPKIYSEHVEVILEFLDNLSVNEAMRAIELYCNSNGFADKVVTK